MFFVILIFAVSCLAETNRSPFDFAEGESELVRGFNTEFRSVGFVIIFLREYISIIFISFLIATFFLSTNTLEIVVFTSLAGTFYI